MALELTRDQLFYNHQLSHDQIDDLLVENESQHFPESKAQHLGKLHEFFALSKLLTENGIDFIPLKGPVLSYRIYQDPLYRSYNDLDFLISTQTIQKALDVLTENGYLLPVYNFPDDECRKKILYKHMNVLVLNHPKYDVGVELHWKLFVSDFVDETILQEIIKTKQIKIEFNSQNYSVFSIEFELLFLIIHGGLHHWNKLKWLVDIKEILAKYNIDDYEFQNITSKLNAHRLVAVCNELLKIYFPSSKLLPCTRLAPQHLLHYSCKQINEKAREDHKSVLNYILSFLNSLRAFPGFKYKINIIKHMLFATDLAAKKWMPCSEIVYYFVSPFWKLWRGFR